MIFIAKRYELSIKVDYLSIIFETITAEQLIRRLLNLPFEFFNIRNANVKHKKYTKLYEFGMIRIFGDIPVSSDNPKGLGCYLVLGGQACSDLHRIFDKGDGFTGFFRYCNDYLKNTGYHVTRIDIAIDDKNETPYFTVEQIKRKCLNNEFVSNCKSYRFSESSFDDDTAKTVYIGDGKSNLSFRFYDKDKEVCGKFNTPYDEMGSWKRTELQLRDDKAHAFAMLMIEEYDRLGDLAFNLLASSLRFVTRDKNQLNKSRWKTCTFWKRFLGAVNPLKIKIENPVNSLRETQDWLLYGGTLSAIKAFLFLQDYEALGDLIAIEELLPKVFYSPALSSKMVSHLSRLGREDLIPLVYKDTKNIDNNRDEE